VASFVIDQSVEINSLARSLNAVLPDDIVVIEANEVTSDFNARFSTKGRHYKYYINQGPIAIKRNYCWQVFYKLDLVLMQKCAKQIIGEHDFSSFCKVDLNTKDNLCTVTSAEWAQHNRSLEFDITANRFLHGMVRTLVGTMVNVGRRYTTYDEFAHILEIRDRTMAGMTAPAKGLFLEEVIY
jgi:tRNA pseudouridine38-40 synthase